MITIMIMIVITIMIGGLGLTNLDTNIYSSKLVILEGEILIYEKRRK